MAPQLSYRPPGQVAAQHVTAVPCSSLVCCCCARCAEYLLPLSAVCLCSVPCCVWTPSPISPVGPTGQAVCGHQVLPPATCPQQHHTGGFTPVISTSTVFQYVCSMMLYRPSTQSLAVSDSWLSDLGTPPFAFNGHGRNGSSTYGVVSLLVPHVLLYAGLVHQTHRLLESTATAAATARSKTARAGPAPAAPRRGALPAAQRRVLTAACQQLGPCQALAPQTEALLVR
jgi:hypothetical protein